MKLNEYNNFRLRTLAQANGRNIHDLPPLLGYLENAVVSLEKREDVDFSISTIEMCMRNIYALLHK